MELDFKAMARAVACTLEWERLNGRGAFLDENSLRRSLAEHVQSVTTAIVEPEYNHDDIPGNKRLDVVGFGPQQKKIEFAVEAKWIKEGGGTRDWHAELADDIFRLECLTTDMAQRDHRILVVAGIRGRVDSGLINKSKNVKKKNKSNDPTKKPKRLKWVDAILPSTVGSQSRTFKVRDCKEAFTDFFKARSKSVGLKKLPISFQARLVAHYRTDEKDKKATESYVWLVGRSTGRREFTP